MNIRNLSIHLGKTPPPKLTGIKIYHRLRQFCFDKYNKKVKFPFQSTSIKPSTDIQRSSCQTKSEHSVYQRSDFTPLTLESDFNNYFPKIGSISPFTLMFNSGMGAISSIAYFLYAHKKINKLNLGENVYFETKWLIEDYGKYKYFNEYVLNIDNQSDVYWFEYPINCTKPDKYPFNQQLELIKYFEKLQKIVSSSKRHHYFVIDYTLFTIPFDLTRYFKKLPSNLTVILITSLQKHRGLGLDLTNGGAVTIYSHSSVDDSEYLSRIRAIHGSLITQETQWLMPPLNSKLINKIIIDSGLEAKRIYHLTNRPELPVNLYFADNKDFLTSFIFLKIDKKLMVKSVNLPYFSDLLMTKIVKAAKRNHTTVVQGTSFGFPFTRIFKNSERYQNTDTLRIAIGYDPEMNKDVDKAITEGIDDYLQAVSANSIN